MYADFSFSSRFFPQADIALSSNLKEEEEKEEEVDDDDGEEEEKHDDKFRHET
jgi:hypothetical protein